MNEEVAILKERLRLENLTHVYKDDLIKTLEKLVKSKDDIIKDLEVKIGELREKSNN